MNTKKKVLIFLPLSIILISFILYNIMIFSIEKVNEIISDKENANELFYTPQNTTDIPLISGQDLIYNKEQEGLRNKNGNKKYYSNTSKQ